MRLSCKPRLSHKKLGPAGEEGERGGGIGGREGERDRRQGDGGRGGEGVDAGCSSWVSYDLFIGKKRKVYCCSSFPADVRPTTPNMNALCIYGIQRCS